MDCVPRKIVFLYYLVIHFHQNIFSGGTPTWNHIDFVSPDEIEVLGQFRGFHVDYFAEGPKPTCGPRKNLSTTISLVDIYIYIIKIWQT